MPRDLQLQITEDVVALFMELTGDRSSLHADQPFAERSPYRRRVVHGMLPVAFLAALDLADPDPVSWRLSRLAGRFLKPVFLGDRLSLSASVVADGRSEDVREVECTIRRAESGGPVTTATVVLRRGGPGGGGEPPSGVAREAGRPGLVLDPLVEREYRLDDLSKGQEAEFRFTVTAPSLAVFRRILAAGVAAAGPGVAGSIPEAPLVDLLAGCLLSTMVGMFLPGRHATFLEFALDYSVPIRLDAAYRFRSRIEHKSRSTGVLTEAVTILGAGAEARPCAAGIVRVKVNEPERKGPALATLREMESDLQLKDKVVLVTGASRGIGATTAKLFALHGARVVVNYRRSQAEADQVVADISQGGGEALAVRADVADAHEVRAMMDAIRRTYGSLHVLVNNAVADAYPVPFMELTWEAIQRDLDVVLKGAFHCCREALPMMLGQRWGRIINLSTLFTDNPPVGQTKYVAAKGALTGLTRSLAKEVAGDNVLVNMVVASIVETDLSSHVPKVFLKGMMSNTPMKRNATTIDVAKAVVFLASSLASFTTGQRIMVTGGNPPFV